MHAQTDGRMSRRCSTTWATVGIDHLGRYGHLFPDELDHLADRLDRLHAEAAVYPACTDALVPPSGKAKGLVGDQALLVEVGRLELWPAS